MTMLTPITDDLFDGEHNQIPLDTAYRLASDSSPADFADAMSKIKTAWNNVSLVPISGSSAGGGVFQQRPDNGHAAVGVKIEPARNPEVVIGKIELTDVKFNQIVIDKNKKQISAGAAITLEQLNLALGAEMGCEYRVLGADLTSCRYAQVGATFMTGGMGPQRRYFSDSVREIALYDGRRLEIISDEDLQGYAGTFGWTGFVTAVRCSCRRLPANEIAFAIPVRNEAEKLSDLIAHFSSFCYLNENADAALASRSGMNIILGLEHVTVAAMQTMLSRGTDSTVIRQSRALMKKCENADAEGLIFVNGFSEQSPEDFVAGLIDDSGSDNPTIAGIHLDHTQLFRNSDEMRDIREAIPAAARAQSLNRRYSLKNHTDLNISLNRDRVKESFAAFWKLTLLYVDAIQGYIRAAGDLQGEIIMYGHLNPVGMDPHNRITIATDDKEKFEAAKLFITRQRNNYFLQADLLCRRYGAEFIGGEKSAGSECKIFAAFGGVQNSPALLRKKYRRQNKRIKASHPMFNWRAMPPYGK